MLSLPLSHPHRVGVAVVVAAEAMAEAGGLLLCIAVAAVAVEDVAMEAVEVSKDSWLILAFCKCFQRSCLIVKFLGCTIIAEQG